MPNRIITLEDLTSRSACEERVEMFKVAYPDGFEVTEANLLEANANGLDVLWTRCLLGDSEREAYDAVCASAFEVCEAVCDSAWEAYEAVRAPAYQTYEAAVERVPAREVFDAVCASALEVCEAVCDSAWAVYEVARIKALAIALNS